MQIQRVVSTFLVKYGGVIGAGESGACTSASDSSSPSLPIVAVFHRQDTMPTYPSHWAACSGTIERGETPWDAAQRELQEETNWVPPTIQKQQRSKRRQQNESRSENENMRPFVVQDGLFVDVAYKSHRRRALTAETSSNGKDKGGADRTIRVYPFVVQVPNDFEIELKGTEHDRFDWVSVAQLEELDPAVPSLAVAFHHATRGAFWRDVLSVERHWASDRQNGATTMTRNALTLLKNSDNYDTAAVNPSRISVLRPTMVTIVNSMKLIENKVKQSASSKNMKQASQEVEPMIDIESKRSIEAAVDRILSCFSNRDLTANKKIQIATFSRSSTIVAVVKELVVKLDTERLSENGTPIDLKFPIVCGRSTPGGEGEYMARDLNNFPSVCSTSIKNLNRDGPTAVCVSDQDLREQILDGNIDLLLIGADCVLTNQKEHNDATSDESSQQVQYVSIINKVGTRLLLEAATQLKLSGGDCQRLSVRTRVLCCTDRFKLWDDEFPPPLELDLFEVIPTSICTVLEVVLPPAL